MSVYLFAPGPVNAELEAAERRLNELVSGLRKIEKIEQAASEIGALAGTQKVVVIFLSPPLGDGSLENFITLARRQKERIFFILVTPDISAAAYKRVIQSGGADWISSSGSLDEISEILAREHGAVSSPEAASGRGFIASFLPALGGVGNTSIALDVALQIKKAKGSRALRISYIDLNFQSGRAADYLDIEPRLQIEEIIDRPERMDDQLLELFVNHHPSGLDVFTAPPSKMDPCEVGLSSLDILFDLIVQRYQLVIVDLPVFWFTWTAPTLENSDFIALSAINTVPCLRALRTNLELVRKSKKPAAQLGVAINRVESSLFGQIRRRQHVNLVAGDEKVFYIHEDPRSVARVNRGLPAALDGSAKFSKDCKPLADMCRLALKQRVPL